MDIVNNNRALLFELNGVPLYLTDSMFATWIVSAVLIVFAVIVRIKLRKFKKVPSGFQNAVEALVELVGNLTKSVLGEKLEFLGAYFFGVFVFIIAANYSGIFGLRPPTTDLATNLSLALGTFFLIHYHGIRMRKLDYVKDYFSPFFLFLPFNILGQLGKPVSLSFRLFGNILGGFIILEVMYSMLPVVARFFLPAIGHVFFDLFGGFLQAFVFTMLSMTFVQVMAEKPE